MKLSLKSFSLPAALIIITGIAPAAQTTSTDNLAALALEESAIPVRPGIPGEQPFWNKRARRFIHAPALDFPKVPGAEIYRFDVFSEASETTYSFTSHVPYAPLSPIWTKLPVGFFSIKMTARTQDDDLLGTAAEARFYRAAPFAGPYHEPPVMPYDESARLALDKLLHKDYVEYWLTHKKPHPDYPLYRYPAKIYSALVTGAVTQARLKPEEADRSTSLATIIADYMIEISVPEDHAWAHHPPTYHGPRIGKNPKSHMQLDNYLTIMGADSGNAFLEVYNLTKDSKYLEAAKSIAETYKKTQLENGTWYLYANSETNKPTAENMAIPTAMVNFFDRLAADYNVEGLEEVKNKALAWTMENPVKTFDWQGQFEDVKAHPPYFNLSREQACDLAIYLFKNNQHIDLARELVRFAEDQFVIWEKPMPFSVKPNNKNPGWHSRNWMPPSVQEQHGFWMPVMRSAGIMMETYRQAHAATGEALYLAKAKSLANSITRVQKANNGEYVTMFIDTPWTYWLNSTVYPARQMMTLQDYLESLH